MLLSKIKIRQSLSLKVLLTSLAFSIIIAAVIGISVHNRVATTIINEKIANEIHGTSVIDACKWVIDARNEAMSDKRRLMHRSTIRVIEVDSENSAAMNNLRTQWNEAIRNGEVMILPKTKETDLKIIYEDQELVVIIKENGLLTISTEKEKIHTA